MSTTPSEGLPDADTQTEVLGTIHYVLNSLGRELGDRYDAHLKATIGPNWAPALANIRHQKHINIHDPHFVLSEPLKYPDSPTRACLPSGGAFYNQLEVALDVRNAWSHHEVAPLNLASLKASVTAIHTFATAAEMQLGKLCSDIKKRINAITSGAYPPAGTAPAQTPSVDVDGLLADLAAARANEDALKADVSAAQALLDEAAHAGEARADLAAQLAAIQARLDEALADKQKLEFVIEALASAETDGPPGADWVQATPGHTWPGSLPPRRVTMMSLHPDLFDETTRQRVAREFGPAAVATIAAWKAAVSPNATVFLSPLGQAVSYVNGVPIYLGTLGEQDALHVTEPAAAGFFIPHTYTLRMNGTIEDRKTDQALEDVNPTAAGPVGARLLAALPTGGRIRVTTSGAVASSVNGVWRELCTVEAGEWFPTHLD